MTTIFKTDKVGTFTTARSVLELFAANNPQYHFDFIEGVEVLFIYRPHKFRIALNKMHTLFYRDKCLMLYFPDLCIYFWDDELTVQITMC